MGWDDQNDPNLEPRRRPRRDWYGESDDAWGAADAEDRYDEGAAEDLYFDHHAAGLDYDPKFDQPYPSNQPDYAANIPATGVPPSAWSANSDPLGSSELPSRAQDLQGRIQGLRRRGERLASNRQEIVQQSKPADRWMPCGFNATLAFVFVGLFFLMNSVMAVLATRALIRLLGV